MLILFPRFLFFLLGSFTNTRRNSEPACAFASMNASPLPTDSAGVGGASSSTSALPPFDLREFWEEEDPWVHSLTEDLAPRSEVVPPTFDVTEFWNEEDAWVHSLTEDLAPRSEAVPPPFDVTEFWKEEDAWVQSLTVSPRKASHTSPAAAASSQD